MLQNYSSGQGARGYQFPKSFSMPLRIVGGNKFGRYKKISSEETFNMMVSDGALVNFAGHKKVKPIGGKQGRGIYSSTRLNKMIVVSDEDVYAIDDNITSSLVGNLETVDGEVYIAENLNGQIALCDGLKIYIYDYKNPSFYSPTIDFLPGHISFQDGYFIASTKNNNQWRLSGPNDGQSFPPDATNIGDLQTKPTNTIACVPFDRQLFVFGSDVCEPWKNIGTGIFPYQRSSSMVIDYGCLNPATIASGFSKIVWLASNEKSNVSIMFSEGGSAQRISNDGLDFVLSKIKYPQHSFGFLFQLDGHIFYQITFTKDNLTYVYDFNLNEFYSLTDQNLNHHIAKRMVFFNGKNYFISFIDGDLYELSSSYYDFNGYEMPKYRILNNTRLDNGSLFVCQNISITMEQGFNKGEQAINLSISRDGGETFGNIYRKKLNTWGNRPNTCNFYNLGAANDFCFKFSFLGLERTVVCDAKGNFYQ
jgi:hypothetical protein